MTFGSLVNVFVKCFSPPEYLEDELDNMIYFRNELAHRISKFIISKASSHEWHDGVIKELGEIECFFVETNGMLFPYIDAYYKKLNLNEEKVIEIAFSMCPHLRKDD